MADIFIIPKSNPIAFQQITTETPNLRNTQLQDEYNLPSFTSISFFQPIATIDTINIQLTTNRKPEDITISRVDYDTLEETVLSITPTQLFDYKDSNGNKVFAFLIPQTESEKQFAIKIESKSVNYEPIFSYSNWIESKVKYSKYPLIEYQNQDGDGCIYPHSFKIRIYASFNNQSNITENKIYTGFDNKTKLTKSVNRIIYTPLIHFMPIYLAEIFMLVFSKSLLYVDGQRMTTFEAFKFEQMQLTQIASCTVKTTDFDYENYTDKLNLGIEGGSTPITCSYWTFSDIVTDIVHFSDNPNDKATFN